MAKLVLNQSRRTLAATLDIDGHLLKGEASTNGTEFKIDLGHADGTGPGHADHLRLTGKLDGDKILGTWDDGTSSGKWTGTRDE